MPTRRDVLRSGSLCLAGLFLGGPCWSAMDRVVIDIVMRSDPTGAHVSFDPIGLLVRPGQQVRWVNAGNNVHTTTAYHPANAHHPLRLPAGALPWDSGYLVNPGDSFVVRFTIAGVYDYYCTPHERAGMVGRIVVATPGDARPAFSANYPDEAGNPAWTRVPEAALRNFPTVEAILKQG